MNIRIATEKDLDRLQEIWEEFMQLHIELEPHLALNDRSREIHLSFLKADIADDRFHLIVAEQEEYIMGYCLAEIQNEAPIFEIQNYVYIHDMAIAPEHRRKGVGTALFNAMKDWIKEQGIQHVRLQILEANPMSSSFWPRQGFQEFTRTLWIDLD